MRPVILFYPYSVIWYFKLQIVEDLKKTMHNCPDGSLHAIFDIWTSKQNKSVLGVKVQYVRNWKIRTAILGFKEFDKSHKAENIRTMLEDLLNIFNITPAKVSNYYFCQTGLATDISIIYSHYFISLHPLRLTTLQIIKLLSIRRMWS